VFSFTSKLFQVFVIQLIGDGDMNLIPTIVPSFVIADQQYRHSARVKGIKRSIWASGVLRSKFTHVSMFGAVNATAVGMTKRWTPRLQQLDRSGHRNLLGLRQTGPPVAKFIGVFDIPGHASNITSKEYFFKATKTTTASLRRVNPVFHFQGRHPLELPDVVGDQHEAFAASVRCNVQVVHTDGLAEFF
jgi:hypothetical protein